MHKCKWPEGRKRDDVPEEFYDGLEPCPHPAEAEQDYCIFHLPLESKKDPKTAQKFTDEFYKKIKKDDKDKTGALRYFVGFEFPDEFTLDEHDFRPFYKVGVRKGEELFGPLDFRLARFGNNLSCVGCKFGDLAIFHFAHFGNSANFKTARFGYGSLFAHAEFGDWTKFSGAQFGGQARFLRATFRGVAWFDSLTGFERTGLENILSKSIGAHTGVENHPETIRRTTGNLARPAPPELSFVATEFKGPAIFHDDDLSRVLFQQVDMALISFLYSQINKTRFVACEWGRGKEKWKWVPLFPRPRLLLDEIFVEAVIRDKPVEMEHEGSDFLFLAKDVNINQKKTKGKSVYILEKDFNMDLPRVRPPDVQAVALQLKQSQENTRDTIAAGDFHFANMEMKRLQAKLDANGEIKGRRRRAWSLGWYKFLSGYGERYIRTLIWLFVLIVVAGLLYFWLTSINQATLMSCPKNLAKCVDVGAQYPWYKHLWDCIVYAAQHVLPFKFQETALHVVGQKIKTLSFIQTVIGTSLFAMFILALRSRFRR